MNNNNNNNIKDINDISKAMSILSVSNDFQITEEILLNIISSMQTASIKSISFNDLIIKLNDIKINNTNNNNKYSPEYKFSSPDNKIYNSLNLNKEIPSFDSLNHSKNLSNSLEKMSINNNSDDNVNNSNKETNKKFEDDKIREFDNNVKFSVGINTRRKAKSKIHNDNDNDNKYSYSNSNNNNNKFSSLFSDNSSNNSNNSKSFAWTDFDPLSLPFTSPSKKDSNNNININSNNNSTEKSNIDIKLNNIYSTPVTNNQSKQEKENNNIPSKTNNLNINTDTPTSVDMDTNNNVDINTPYPPSSNTFLFTFGSTNTTNTTTPSNNTNNDIFFSPGVTNNQSATKIFNKKIKLPNHRKLNTRSNRTTPTSNRVNRKMKPNVDSNDNQINSDNDDTTEDVNHHIDSNINSKIFKNSSNKENSNNINDNLDTSIFGAPGFESTLSPGSPAFGTASSFSDSSTNMSINQSNSNKYKSNLDKPQNKSFTLPDMPINSYEEFANNFVDTDSKKELNENTNSSKSASSNIKSEESTQVDNSLAILADMYRKQGRDFYSNEDYVNALDSFSKALIQAPRNWPNKLAVLGNRAATYMMLNRYIEAIDDCNNAILIDKTILKLYTRKARAYLRLGRLRESEDLFLYVSSMKKSNNISTFDSNELDKNIEECLEYLKLIQTIKNSIDLVSINESQQNYQQVILLSDDILQTCIYSFQIIKSKATALLRQYKYSECKSFIESIYCNIHSTILSNISHQLVTLPIALESSLIWDYDSKLKTILIDNNTVINFILWLGNDISYIYLNVLKNLDINRFVSTNVINEISFIVNQLYIKMNQSNSLWDWVTNERNKIDKLKSNKLSGDNCFRNKKFYEALDFYSQALEADITAVRWKAILFNNRAAAYMSLDMLNDALCDCNESIKCDDKYFKANLRRARVFRSQNRYNDSMNDYNIYLKSISNVYSSDEYNEISKEMNDYMLSRRTKPNNPPPSNNRWEKSPNNKNYNTNTSYGDSYQSFDKKYSNNNNNSSYGKIESDDEDDDCGGGNYDQWAYPRQGNYTKPQSPKPKSPNNKGFNYSSYYNNNNNQNQYERSYKGDYFKSNANYNKSSNNSKYFNNTNNQQPQNNKQNEDDYYYLLNISTTASEREIKLAFRKLALLYHPDKNKDAGAEDMFKKITSAYTTLSDKSTRYKYDLSRP